MALTMLRGPDRATLYDPPMDDAADRAERSARELARRSGRERHDVLVVLGTGLARTAELLGAGDDGLPLDTLPFFPPFSVDGHVALGWSVSVAGRQVLLYGGRCHLYEGHAPRDVVHPVRTAMAAGCTTVVLTAAAGGLRSDLGNGSVVVVEDHLNLTGCSPLDGPVFVDMTGAYDPGLQALALAAPDPARAALARRPGVYAQVRGPQLETPAEIRMLGTLGADVVGMSMALETIAARQAGARVLGLAVVTNPAATHEAALDVAGIGAVGAAAAPAVAAIVRHVVGSSS
jgi:purine-nucleoside phosphorylase